MLAVESSLQSHPAWVYSELNFWRAARPKVGAPVPMCGTPRCTDKAGPDKVAVGSWLDQIRLEHSPGAGEERSLKPEGKPLTCTAKA